MAQTIDMKAIRKLSVAQRHALMARIWDTLAEDEAEIPVSEETKGEMRRRVQELKDNPSSGKSHAEVMRWLESRSKK